MIESNPEDFMVLSHKLLRLYSSPKGEQNQSPEREMKQEMSSGDERKVEKIELVCTVAGQVNQIE